MLPDKTLIQTLIDQYESARVARILSQFKRAQDSVGDQTMLTQMGADIGQPPVCHMAVVREQSAIVGQIGLGEYMIGRGLSCAIQLSFDNISRQHALVTVHHDRITIRDLQSRNGTFVDGIKLGDDPVRAEERIIRMCNVYMLFQFTNTPNT